MGSFWDFLSPKKMREAEDDLKYCAPVEVLRRVRRQDEWKSVAAGAFVTDPQGTDDPAVCQVCKKAEIDDVFAGTCVGCDKARPRYELSGAQKRRLKQWWSRTGAAQYAQRMKVDTRDRRLDAFYKIAAEVGEGGLLQMSLHVVNHPEDVPEPLRLAASRREELKAVLVSGGDSSFGAAFEILGGNTTLAEMEAAINFLREELGVRGRPSNPG